MLTKTQFLYFLQCPKYLWLYKNRKDLLEAEGDIGYKQAQGENVEYWAYQDYPDAIDCKTDGDIFADIDNTKKVISSSPQAVIQSSFFDGELFCRNDLLVRISGDEWNLIEVKATTKVEDIHIIDLAFQKQCLSSCGININRIYVYHVNNKYVRKGEINPEELISKEDVTDKVNFIEMSTRQKIKDALEFMKVYKDEPAVDIVKQCFNPYDCGFINYCWKDVPEHSVYDLSLKESDLRNLVKQGNLEIENIPFNIITRENKKVYYQAYKIGKPIIDIYGIEEELSNISYPAYFLDYESYSPAVPLFDKFHPYQQMVFQYSLHRKEAPDAPLEHFEFLSDDWINPLPILLEKLISDLKESGTIIVWNESFEKSRNKEMGEMYPKQKEALKLINDRIYDLGTAFKKNYYVHKDFKGSWSIKSVLPVLIPELSYKDLNIQGGSQASESYRELIDPSISQEKKESLRRDMLKYCELDTLAMVRILEKMEEMIRKRP
ncbi:MAG: hypothetical protein MNSN_07180 [Minisyncoccus archaeiphilus]|uniref:DUF2779 domain-containing protein n=1 Tax=Minisyncoccus archaeiphilus TaxID=3238481 RepID=UPI002B134506|nr:MAG: hypothetical protein MNSN_07180 [Candidatus Parcubacteria bacterium]